MILHKLMVVPLKEKESEAKNKEFSIHKMKNSISKNSLSFIFPGRRKEKSKRNERSFELSIRGNNVPPQFFGPVQGLRKQHMTAGSRPVLFEVINLIVHQAGQDVFRPSVGNDHARLKMLVLVEANPDLANLALEKRLGVL